MAEMPFFISWEIFPGKFFLIVGNILFINRKNDKQQFYQQVIVEKISLSTYIVYNFVAVFDRFLIFQHVNAIVYKFIDSI